MPELVYRCNNPSTAAVGPNGSTMHGTCGGMTLEWARNVVSLNAAPSALNGLNTLPSMDHAQETQRNWVRTYSMEAALQSSEVSATPLSCNSIDQAVDIVARSSGNQVHTLQVTQPGPPPRSHLVGLLKSGRDLYYFEPNRGLYRSRSRTEISRQMQQNLGGWLGDLQTAQFHMHSIATGLRQGQAFAPDLGTIPLPDGTPLPQPSQLPQSHQGPSSSQSHPQGTHFAQPHQQPQPIYMNPYAQGPWQAHAAAGPIYFFPPMPNPQPMQMMGPPQPVNLQPQLTQGFMPHGSMSYAPGPVQQGYYPQPYVPPHPHVVTQPNPQQLMTTQAVNASQNHGPPPQPSTSRRRCC